MKYIELRNKIKNWNKHKDCKDIERSPLLNPGFLGTFNLSFTEDIWLKEYNRYIDFDHNLTFSTIQSCIRPQDIPLLETQDSWKYLGVFEMADLNGVLTLKDRPDFEKLQEKQIKTLIGFLKELGISPENIYPSYHAGGQVKDITEEKYNFDYKIPEDGISKKTFLKLGIPKDNIIKDSTRDTLLCLHVHQPTPWGYRNEINVNVGTKENPKLLDVATIEYTLWKPVFKGDNMLSKNIVGLEDSKDGFSIVAIGAERLNMAINNLKRVQDIDYIKPFYDKWKELSLKENLLAAESLRALHRIYSDITSCNIVPGWNQKKKIRALIRNLPKNLTSEKIKILLSVLIKGQPWHKNLKAGINPTLDRIETYRNTNLSYPK